MFPDTGLPQCLTQPKPSDDECKQTVFHTKNVRWPSEAAVVAPADVAPRAVGGAPGGHRDAHVLLGRCARAVRCNVCGRGSSSCDCVLWWTCFVLWGRCMDMLCRGRRTVHRANSRLLGTHFPPMAKVIGVTTVFPDTGLPQCLTRPKHSDNEFKQTVFHTKNVRWPSKSAAPPVVGGGSGER